MAGGIDRRPAAIVRVADAADVSSVVALARETGMELAVRSGGHSGLGHGVTEGGIVLDLRDMKGLEIDPERRTAWAETGLTAGEVTKAAAAHGLAIGFGDTGSVGIGGLTVGGGIGYLVRKYGLTIDDAARRRGRDRRRRRLRSGRRRHAPRPVLGDSAAAAATSASSPASSSGSMRSTRSSAGCSILPATAGHVAGFIAAAEAAPEELSTIANVMPCPPMPFVPEEHHGKLVILGAHGLRRRGRGRRTGDGAVPGARRHRSPTWSSRCPTPRSTRRRTSRGVPPAGGRAPTIFMDRVDATSRDDPRAPRGLGRDDARDPAARPRRGDGPRSGGRDRVRPSVQPDHGHVRRLRTRATTGRRARGAGSTRVAAELRPGRRAARTSTSSGTRARTGSARAYPRATWDRRWARQGALRPGQPVPPEPERPASGTISNGTPISANSSRRAPPPLRRSSSPSWSSTAWR